MEHDQIVERLSEYRDGALDAAAREDVSRHLAGCSTCSAVLADWEALSKAFLRRPPAPTAFQTEAFVARVAARLPARESASFAWLTGRVLVPALGLSVVALAFSFRPYPVADSSDPSAALLADADRGGAALSAPDASGAEILGLNGDER
ncbi:MAG: anti-sigma factor family protein [Elusimicrobiota bacterium]